MGDSAALVVASIALLVAAAGVWLLFTHVYGSIDELRKSRNRKKLANLEEGDEENESAS